MSLIVGIRCADSVVLAASGPETMPSEDGLAPARQWAKKVRVIGGRAVLGVSGHDGLAQEMALSLERSLDEIDPSDAAEDVLRSTIRDALAAPIQRTVAIHRTLQGLPGYGITSNEYVVSQSMVAIPVRDSLRLYVQDPECSLTEITDELSYAAIGSGRTVADPFLFFLREVTWTDRPPNQARGELTAYWTVRHAIDSNPTHLTYPIQLIVIARRSDGSIDFIERGDRELAAIAQVMESNLESIRKNFLAEPHSGGGSGSRGGSGGSGGAPRRSQTVPEKPIRKRVPEVRLKLEPPDPSRGPSSW